MKIKWSVLILCLVLLLSGCGIRETDDDGTQGTQGTQSTTSTTTTPTGSTQAGTQGSVADLGDDDKTFGEQLENTEAYDGNFTGESKDITVTCVSGTPRCLQAGRFHTGFYDGYGRFGLFGFGNLYGEYRY